MGLSEGGSAATVRRLAKGERGVFGGMGSASRFARFNAHLCSRVRQAADRRSTHTHWSVGLLVAGATCVAALFGTAAPVAAASTARPHLVAGMDKASLGLAEHALTNKVVTPVDCTFNGVHSNGVLGGTLTNVTPGEQVEIACSGDFLPYALVAAGEESPLVATSATPSNEMDAADVE